MTNSHPIDSFDFQSQLMQHRGAIDAIDKQLLSLLKERINVVQKVGALKSDYGISGSYIRPGREAVMIKDLLALNAQKQSDFADEAIIAIWRIIIGCSTATESPLNTLTLTQDAHARALSTQYFSACVPTKAAYIDDLLHHLKTDRHAVAILPYDVDASYWHILPKDCYVFACLPFYGTPTHLAVGYVIPEETGDDISLFKDKTLVTKHGFHYGKTDCIGSYGAPIPKQT